MDWFMEAVRKYAVFSGRSRRKEFWFFILFYFIALVILTIVDMSIGFYDEEAGTGLLSSIFLLAMFLPSLSVSVRRLHDTDRSGWWVLVSLIPVIGWIVYLVFMALDGTPGENRFGPNPKQQGADGLS